MRWVDDVGNDSDSSASDLESFYGASYSRLVTVVGLVAQDRGDAEEAVQDAFVRLIGQWQKVSRYEDPEAWVRKVALGFLSNRRRKVSRGLRALARYGPPGDVPPPSPDRVDVTRALGTLPQHQREVIVLQDLGLSIDAIADQLNVPAGTVKSRLSRARATLAPLLREEVQHRA